MLGCLAGAWMGSKCQCVSRFFIHNGSQNFEKYVSVHNFKSESFLGTLNSMVVGGKSLIFASTCPPVGSVLSFSRSWPWQFSRRPLQVVL